MKKLLLCMLLKSSANLAFQIVDINHASIEQIALLPGIGNKLAKELVSFRAKNGPFVQEQDLRAVAGMREHHLKKISTLIIFGKTPKKPKLEKAQELTFLASRPLISLSALEKQVLKTLSLGDSWESSMLERSRKAALVPKINLAFDYDRQIDLSEKKIGAKTDSALSRGGHDLGFGLRASFDLGEAIFHKETLEISNLALKRLEKREKIIERVHNLFFRYERLQALGLRPSDAVSINNIKNELSEIAAALDAISNKAFSAFQAHENMP